MSVIFATLTSTRLGQSHFLQHFICGASNDGNSLALMWRSLCARVGKMKTKLCIGFSWKINPISTTRFPQGQTDWQIVVIVIPHWCIIHLYNLGPFQTILCPDYGSRSWFAHSRIEFSSDMNNEWTFRMSRCYRHVDKYFSSWFLWPRERQKWLRLGLSRWWLLHKLILSWMDGMLVAIKGNTIWTVWIRKQCQTCPRSWLIIIKHLLRNW